MYSSKEIAVLVYKVNSRNGSVYYLIKKAVIVISRNLISRKIS